MNSGMEGLHDGLDEMIGDWADNAGLTKNQVVSMIDRQYGIDLTDVDDDDADDFVEAANSDPPDVDAIAEILDDYGVGEDEIKQFKAMVEPDSDSGNDGSGGSSGGTDAGTQARENGESASGGSSGGSGLDRDEVQSMIQQEVQQAVDPDAIAASLRDQMGAGGGGAGGGGQQSQQQGGGGGGAMSPEFQSMLAQAISQKFLGGGGGGQMAQLGEQFQKAAMNSFIQRMQKPTLGDLVERRMYEDMADEYAEEYKSEFLDKDPMDALEEDEGDDGDDQGWSFGF